MDWIRKQALLYRNLALTNRYQAVVHLEDKEDESFWDNQLQQVKRGRYCYLYFSKSDSGTDSRGCEQCLRFRPYLTDKFFICIDSDLRLLKGEDGLNVANHIAQTYTYSWENHLCEVHQLCKRMERNSASDTFDLMAFIAAFSKIVYRPLLYLVHYSANSHLNKLWNVSKFNACIPLQPKRMELEENGKIYLNNMRQRFDEAIDGLEELPAVVPSLTEANAYLHIQGHQLYKLVLHIGTQLYRGRKVAFKSEVLDKGFHTTGYDEIEALQRDLNVIMNK